MSEPNAAFGSSPVEDVRPETLTSAKNWTVPNPQEISGMLNRARIKWSELPALTNNPSEAVELWEKGLKNIDYMTWRFICERAGYGRIETFNQAESK